MQGFGSDGSGASSGVVKTPDWGAGKTQCENGGYEVEKGICMVEFPHPLAPANGGESFGNVPTMLMEGFMQGATTKEIKMAPSGVLEVKDSASGQVSSFQAGTGGDFQTVIKLSPKEVLFGQAGPNDEISVRFFKGSGGEKAMFGVGSVNASLEVSLEVKEGKVFSDNKEVKILPDRASKIAVEKLGDIFGSISLKDVPAGEKSSGLAYELNGLSDEKLFGFIKVKVPTDVQIDAVSGELIRSKKPWWSFFSF
ncbi:MAG: hypothetical protein V1885_00055 [Candidatus Brennerbacteria bacterium]